MDGPFFKTSVSSSVLHFLPSHPLSFTLSRQDTYLLGVSIVVAHSCEVEGSTHLCTMHAEFFYEAVHVDPMTDGGS